MAMPIYEISHSGARDGVFASQGRLTDCLTVSTTESVKNKINTCILRFSNPKSAVDGSYKFADRFLADDEISIKIGQGLVSGNVPVGLNLVMDAQVKEWNYDVDKGGRFLQIKGNDIASKLFDFIVQLDFPANLQSAQQIIIDTINSEVNSKIEQQSALGTRSLINTSRMATTKKDGSPFEVVSRGYSFINKTVRQVIDEISIDSNTGDGNYTWWLERDAGVYYLRWEPKPDTIDRQISETEVISFNPNKSVYDVKNFLYLSCGSDDTGRDIRTFAADFVSIADVGWKETYWAYPDAARQARDLGTSGNGLISTTKDICEIMGKDRIDKLNDPRWKCDLTLRGTDDFNLANNIYVFSKGLGEAWVANGADLKPDGTPFQGFKLRIQSINQKYSEKGWMTTLSLEEDAEFTG